MAKLKSISEAGTSVVECGNVGCRFGKKKKLCILERKVAPQMALPHLKDKWSIFEKSFSPSFPQFHPEYCQGLGVQVSCRATKDMQREFDELDTCPGRPRPVQILNSLRSDAAVFKERKPSQ